VRVVRLHREPDSVSEKRVVSTIGSAKTEKGYVVAKMESTACATGRGRDNVSPCSAVHDVADAKNGKKRTPPEGQQQMLCDAFPVVMLMKPIPRRSANRAQSTFEAVLRAGQEKIQSARPRKSAARSMMHRTPATAGMKASGHHARFAPTNGRG